MAQYHFAPNRIFNVDESGMTTVHVRVHVSESGMTTVVAAKGAKQKMLSRRKTVNFDAPRQGVRRYGSKSNNYSEAMMQRALLEISVGEISERFATIKYGVPRNTIRNKRKGNHGKTVGRPQAFTPDEEEAFVNHIIAVSEMGLPVGLYDVRSPLEIIEKREERLFINSPASDDAESVTGEEGRYDRFSTDNRKLRTTFSVDRCTRDVQLRSVEPRVVSDMKASLQGDNRSEGKEVQTPMELDREPGRTTDTPKLPALSKTKRTFNPDDSSDSDDSWLLDDPLPPQLDDVYSNSVSSADVQTSIKDRRGPGKLTEGGTKNYEDSGHPRAEEQTPQHLEPSNVDEGNYCIGQFVVVSYEGDLFPGQITATTSGKITFNSMARKGLHWVWPVRKDELDFDLEDVLFKIAPPVQISRREIYNVPELRKMLV
ncbi:hypothetical protein GE061_011696 [Apolygus lucorum]|uniref:HTH psq-type domain-containing protein n=1 Tax=Apolygus lucorum TaxID=248454 RepID=A0A8S9XYH6_APOLU|nr:hypothetical protein GE061_011696 [Apolygus lucorum]